MKQRITLKQSNLKIDGASPPNGASLPNGTSPLIRGLVPLCLVSCLLAVPSLYSATNDTKRSTRLDLLQQATGGESASSSSLFQDRVDMVFERTQAEGPSVEQVYIDNTIPPQVPVQAKIQTEDNFKLLEQLKKEKSPRENERGKLLGKDNTKSELNQPADQKVRMQEDVLRLLEEKERKDRDAELDRLARREVEKAMDGQYAQGKQEGPQPASDLLPSLANNPFYFSEDSRRSFEDDKSVIISRLVQTGYTRLEAENLIMTASNPEEAILSLMQNEGMKYGQAMELVGTAPQND